VGLSENSDLMNSFKILTFIFMCFFATTLLARPPGYGDGTATQHKIEYCSALVNRSGHLSSQINEGYYGIGVQVPIRGEWALKHVRKPGWFNKDLYIVYTQTTKERYEDYEHRAFCLWEPSGYFRFEITHFDRGGVIVCERYRYVESEQRCP